MKKLMIASLPGKITIGQKQKNRKQYCFRFQNYVIQTNRTSPYCLLYHFYPVMPGKLLPMIFGQFPEA
jgi:hypothetical protein